MILHCKLGTEKPRPMWVLRRMRTPDVGDSISIREVGADNSTSIKVVVRAIDRPPNHRPNVYTVERT